MSVGLVLDERVAEYAAPERTADKLGRRFMANALRRTSPAPEPIVRAPSLEGIRQRVGPVQAYAPKMHEATYRIPIGIRWSAYLKLRDGVVGKWVETMLRKGWDLYPPNGIKAYPGPYPAVDLLTGVGLLDCREGILRAWFCQRQPELVRLEIPAAVFEPLRLKTGDAEPVMSA